MVKLLHYSYGSQSSFEFSSSNGDAEMKYILVAEQVDVYVDKRRVLFHHFFKFMPPLKNILFKKN